MTGNHVKGTLVAGFILGVAAGCTAAFLLAPATGKDSRKAIKTKTVRVTSAVKSRVTKQPETIAEPEFAI